MSLPLPVAFALERAIEAGLVLDPETRTRLAALDGKSVRFQITSPRLELVLIIVDGRVRVPSRDDGDADVTISGTAAALRSLSGSNDALYRGGVRIVGNMGVAQALRGVVAGLDPDWQGALSQVFGGAAVHRLERALRDGSDWFTRSRGAFATNTRDWLEDEVELVATPGEVQAFADDVDDVRATVDRLEARLARLESATTPDS